MGSRDCANRYGTKKDEEVNVIAYTKDACDPGSAGVYQAAARSHISKNAQPNVYVWVRIQTSGRIAYIVREHRGMCSDYAALA